MISSIDPEIRSQIQQRLHQIEQNEGVRILYACESGSRAWGFESQDSDYDVRFLYVRPRDWYLSVDVDLQKDVIELPIHDDFDINGWDIRKALQLIRKSNPSLNEWLISPIVYLEYGEFTQQIRRLIAESFNPIANYYHYLRIASNHYRKYLQKDSVNQKKYLYVLRALFAVNWIENKESLVPVEFQTLFNELATESSLINEIQQLLSIKKAGIESNDGPRFPEIDRFIESELARLDGISIEGTGSRSDIDAINELFRKMIQ